MSEDTLSIANGGFVSKEQMDEMIRRRILRDHFAGLAMQGLINISRGATSSSMSPVYTALAAYEFADAMLKEREKSNGQ